MKYIYPACFYPEESGQFSVIFPDLGGIATYGNNLEDAIYMASDLLCTWALACIKDKIIMPEPSNIKVVKPETDSGFVNLVVGDIDAFIAKNSKPVKKTLTVPAWLNDMAEKEGVNFSQVLQAGLKSTLNLQ